MFADHWITAGVYLLSCHRATFDLDSKLSQTISQAENMVLWLSEAPPPGDDFYPETHTLMDASWTEL